MEMVEVNVSELSGAALDWAVATAEGLGDPLIDVVCCGSGVQSGYGSPPECCGQPEPALSLDRYGKWKPSTDWSQGGPLIEKYQVAYLRDGEDYVAVISRMDDEGFGSGPTHLIAACRAIVAAKLGETVSVPKELLP